MPEHWLTNRNVQCKSAKLKIVHGRGPSNINLRIFVCSFKVYRFTSPCWLRGLEDTNKVNWITYSLGFQKTSQYLSDKSLSVTNEMAERSTPDLFFITRLTLKGINRANLIWHWRVFFFFFCLNFVHSNSSCVKNPNRFLGGLWGDESRHSSMQKRLIQMCENLTWVASTFDRQGFHLLLS